MISIYFRIQVEILGSFFALKVGVDLYMGLKIGCWPITIEVSIS